jgi:hypothetical protein
MLAKRGRQFGKSLSLDQAFRLTAQLKMQGNGAYSEQQDHSVRPWLICVLVCPTTQAQRWRGHGRADGNRDAMLQFAAAHG